MSPSLSWVDCRDSDVPELVARGTEVGTEVGSECGCGADCEEAILTGPVGVGVLSGLEGSPEAIVVGSVARARGRR